MTDILTQKDIDALLRGVTPAGEILPSDVVPYNFVRPPRVSKDRRATLEAIHTRLALSLQALLGSRLRTNVDVTVAGVEQVAFSEFIFSLEIPCAAFVFKIGGRVEGHGVIDLSPAFAYHLIDRLFGGPGESEQLERGLSALEQTVARSVAERMLGLLREAWQEQLAIAPEVTSFESDPETLQIANRDDHVLVATLEVRSGSFTGLVAVCLPMESLEPFLQEKSALRGQGRAQRRVHAASRPVVEASLRHANVTVSARLPALRLTTREVAALAPGQILNTGSPAEARVEVHVNGRIRFLGTLGQVRRRLGLRISDTVVAPEPGRPGRFKEGRIQ